MYRIIGVPGQGHWWTMKGTASPYVATGGWSRLPNTTQPLWSHTFSRNSIHVQAHTATTASCSYQVNGSTRPPPQLTAHQLHRDSHCNPPAAALPTHTCSHALSSDTARKNTMTLLPAMQLTCRCLWSCSHMGRTRTMRKRIPSYMNGAARPPAGVAGVKGHSTCSCRRRSVYDIVSMYWGLEDM